MAEKAGFLVIPGYSGVGRQESKNDHFCLFCRLAHTPPANSQESSFAPKGVPEVSQEVSQEVSLEVSLGESG